MVHKKTLIFSTSHLPLSDFFVFINGALIVEEANRTVQVCAKYTLTRIVEFGTSLTLATSDGTGMCVQHLTLLNHTRTVPIQLLMVLITWECLWTLLNKLASIPETVYAV